jgi:hypothetical protein
MITLVLLCGCDTGGDEEGTSDININDAAVLYMEQRYGEDFEYEAPWGNSMSGTHELLVRSSSMSDRDILVEVRNYKENDKTFKDNYISIRYENEFRDFLRKSVENEFSEAVVFYNTAKFGLSSDVPVDVEFDDYLLESDLFVTSFIGIKDIYFTDEESVNNVAEYLFKKIKSARLGITLVFVSEEEYDSLTDDSLRDKVVNREFSYCVRISRGNGIESVEFVEED